MVTNPGADDDVFSSDARAMQHPVFPGLWNHAAGLPSVLLHTLAAGRASCAFAMMNSPLEFGQDGDPSKRCRSGAWCSQ